MANVSDADKFEARLASLEASMKSTSEAIANLGDTKELKGKVDQTALDTASALSLVNTPFFKRPSVVAPGSITVAAALFWFFYPIFSGNVALYTVAHHNILRTDDVMREEFRQDRQDDRDGQLKETRLYSEVKSYITGEFSRRHQAIVASARGDFEYQVSPSAAEWTTDFSIPVFFNADTHDKVFLYVFLKGWGDTISVTDDTSPEKIKVQDLFEIRGASRQDGTPVTLKLIATETTDDFHKIELSDSDMVPSSHNQFHRFDLALTDSGIKTLTRYAELEARKHDNSETVRYDAYVLVQLQPNGAP